MILCCLVFPGHLYEQDLPNITMICISLPAPSTTSSFHRKHNKDPQDYIHIQWAKYRQDSISVCSSTFSDDKSSCKKLTSNYLSRSSSRSSRTSFESRDIVEEMFSNIEVWIAAHRDGKIAKIMEASEDLFVNVNNVEEPSWQVTLRPRYRYTLCDSLWI